MNYNKEETSEASHPISEDELGEESEEGELEEMELFEEGTFHFEDDEVEDEDEEEEEDVSKSEKEGIYQPSILYPDVADTIPEEKKESDEELFRYLLSRLPSEAVVADVSERGEKCIREVQKLPESLIPSGLIETFEEIINYIAMYKKAHGMCVVRTSEQTELILAQETKMNELKEELKNYKDELATKDQKMYTFEQKLDAYHLREHELQEEIELHTAEIKHLHEEMQRRDDIQTDIDEEIGTSGRAREAYARQKQKLKQQMDMVQNTLAEMKEERDKVIDLHKGAVLQIEELRKEIVAKNDLLIHREKILAKVDFERNDMKRALFGSKKIFKLVRSSFQNFEEHIYELEKANFSQAAQIDGLLRKTTEIFKQNIYYAEEATKCREKIDVLVKAYDNMFGYLQGQETKLREQLLKVRGLESKLSLLNRKNSKMLLEKKKVIEEKDSVISRHSLCERIINKRESEIACLNKKNAVLLDEKGKLQSIINNLRVEKVQALKKFDDSFIRLTSVKTDQLVQFDEIAALKRELESSKVVTRRLLGDNTALMQKVEVGTEEIRLCRTDHYSAQKEIVAMEREKKHIIAQHNKLIKDKNSLYSKYLECKIQLSNEERKVKLANWRLEHLKEELKDKELLFRNKDIESRKVNYAKRRLEMFYKIIKGKYNNILSVTGGKNRDLIQAKNNLDKTVRTLVKQHEKNVQFHKNMTILKAQLDRRVAEIAILSEKVQVFTSLLSRGESHYNQRLEDIRLLKLEVQKLRKEKGILVKGFQNNADLRSELYFIHKELSEERLRSRALQEQLENPLNYHRWRMLEGTDPKKKELIDKLLMLQKKLYKANEEVSRKNCKLEELQLLYDQLNRKFSTMPSSEDLSQLAELKLMYRKKCDDYKTLDIQLIAVERELSDYKSDVASLKKELNEVKKQYYDIKLKEDRRKLHQTGNVLPKLQPTKKCK